MRTIASLREQRAGRVDALRALTDKAASENRDLNDQEHTTFESGRSEVERLDREIRNAEFLAEAERRSGDAEPLEQRGAQDLSGYSVARAVQGAFAGKLDGLEGEVHQELSRGRESRGVMIPTAMLLGGERRSQTVGAANKGGHTVATQLAPVADRINRPALKVEGLGATVLRDLSGFLDLPNLAASGTASWVAEDGAATRSDATFEKVSMGPKTVAAEYQLSRRLILQSSTAIEDLLRRDLGFLLAQKLDAAAIRGGGSNEPDGILSTAAVGSIPGAGDLVDVAADLIAALELDDVTGTAAFLTHPQILKVARKIKDNQDHVIPLAELFHNQRLEATTQAGSDGSSPAAYPLIYGIWSELVIGYWSAVDVLVNPYHSDVASKGGALLHAFLDADVAVRHGEAFRYAEI